MGRVSQIVWIFVGISSQFFWEFLWGFGHFQIPKIPNFGGEFHENRWVFEIPLPSILLSLLLRIDVCRPDNKAVQYIIRLLQTTDSQYGTLKHSHRKENLFAPKGSQSSRPISD